MNHELHQQTKQNEELKNKYNTARTDLLQQLESTKIDLQSQYEAKGAMEVAWNESQQQLQTQKNQHANDIQLQQEQLKEQEEMGICIQR